MSDPRLTETSSEQPTATSAESAVAARRARQAAALRANLQRRKQQARERDGAADLAVTDLKGNAPCR